MMLLVYMVKRDGFECSHVEFLKSDLESVPVLPLLAAWPWPHHLTRVSLSLLICRVALPLLPRSTTWGERK